AIGHHLVCRQPDPAQPARPDQGWFSSQRGRVLRIGHDPLTAKPRCPRGGLRGRGGATHRRPCPVSQPSLRCVAAPHPPPPRSPGGAPCRGSYPCPVSRNADRDDAAGDRRGSCVFLASGSTGVVAPLAVPACRLTRGLTISEIQSPTVLNPDHRWVNL